MSTDPKQTADASTRIARSLGLGLVVALLVYAAIAVWGDAHGIARALAHFPPHLVLVVAGLSFLNYVLRFVRWQRYLKVLGIELERSTSFTIHLAGLALTVSPGKMGEAFKSWLVRRVNDAPVHVTAPIVLAERFTDLLAFLVIIAVGGLATAPEQAWIFWATLALCVVLLVAATSRTLQERALAIGSRVPVIARFAPRIREALSSTRALLAPREIVWPTIIATAGWSLECTGAWLVADAFAPGSISFPYAAYTFALSAVAGAVLIIAPGGLGVTEASLSALFARKYVSFGVASDVAKTSAVSATFVIRLCTLWFAVALGWIALYAFRRRFGAISDGARPRPARRALPPEAH